MSDFISINNLADLTGNSFSTVQKWGEKGLYPLKKDSKGKEGFFLEDLIDIPQIKEMINSNWEEELTITPLRDYTSVELFAGAGGLALGMHMAGFRHVLLNEMDNLACQTLKRNMPEWNVLEGDIHNIDFSPLNGKIDLLTGGFPCQAFSYAGKKGGLNDARGTLFFELARAVKEIQPKVFVCENVKGLISHDEGQTLKIIRESIRELGYTLIDSKVLKAIMYKVPQKRERLILVAIKNDIAHLVRYSWPSPYKRIMTLRDAFYSGELYQNDVPESEGQKYPIKKEQVMALVPEGGDWRALPVEIQKEYMGGSFFLGGGKTGMARRLSLDEPSLTLTCAPAQKQTERCHPIETRPLTVREYARIQTFPDEWQFVGNLSDQYKQIGNAVPVNLSYAIGRSIIQLLNQIDAINPEESKFDIADKAAKTMLPPELFPLNLFDIQSEYPGSIIENKKKLKKNLDIKDLDDSKNVLISYVPDKYIQNYLDGTAKVYFSGKKFPSTIKLNKLYYFMPYFKGKGIKDLYLIKVARIATKHEIIGTGEENDLRLVFEIKYLTPIFEEFKKTKLNIWHTYTDTNLRALLSF